MKPRLAILTVLVATAAISAAAAPVAIRGGRVVVGDGTVIAGGTVLIDGETIVAVGADVAIPSDATVIDATGKVVWPGMIDPYTTLGMAEVMMDRATNDANETTSTSTAALRASDGIDPDAEPIAVTRLGGVTTVLVSPGNRNPINGQAAIVDLDGRTVADMLVRDRAALVLNYDATRKSSYPSTHPGTVAFIRQTLYDAQAYGERKSRGGGEGKGKAGDGPAKVDLDKEAILAALSGAVPVIAFASSQRDIANALAVAEEFKLRLVLAGAEEIWKAAPEVQRAGVPVLLDGTFEQPGERDPYDRYFRLAATVHAGGIPFAFTTTGNHNVRQLPERAAMSVTFGLPEEAAVRALTLEPARILGIDATRGSLTAGKVANVVVWSGSPLQITSRVERLFIRGRDVPLRSRQEALRDRYAPGPQAGAPR